MHNSNIQFLKFEDAQNLLQMLYQPETCRVCKVTTPLLFLQISGLFTVPIRFYESLNEQNRMCELCMFFQIWLHILMLSYTVPYLKEITLAVPEL